MNKAEIREQALREAIEEVKRIDELFSNSPYVVKIFIGIITSNLERMILEKNEDAE
jgi:hypothetical protein